MDSYIPHNVLDTVVIDVKGQQFGKFEDPVAKERWLISTERSAAVDAIRKTASYMRTSNLPVGFPTETVYGLGADATRSDAVRGIYKAKGRPSDNPLIIHISDLSMLRDLLLPEKVNGNLSHDPIPEIYLPLINRFWPGPLTILLRNPPGSKLAPEVTAGLETFGVRMPNSELALSLISLAGVPLAAPSANASTKPSPTTAEHVLHDLRGRIETILDGGPCQVGVESTVVDGLCDPPVVLRPGGLSLDEIRQVPGWERTVKAYKDESELGSAAPRAPGMKYKHYSPKAKVILYESCAEVNGKQILEQLTIDVRVPTIGLIHTSEQDWPRCAGWDLGIVRSKNDDVVRVDEAEIVAMERELYDSSDKLRANLLDIKLGSGSKAVAHGLFSALRALDLRDADIILVEGIPDDGEIAAAVMNRLRKAATEIRKTK